MLHCCFLTREHAASSFEPFTHPSLNDLGALHLTTEAGVLLTYNQTMRLLTPVCVCMFLSHPLIYAKCECRRRVYTCPTSGMHLHLHFRAPLITRVDIVSHRIFAYPACTTQMWCSMNMSGTNFTTSPEDIANNNYMTARNCIHLPINEQLNIFQEKYAATPPMKTHPQNTCS